jgi:hypothetical protein
MFSEDMRGMYRRLFALFLLSGCLVAFSLSSSVESANAAVCMQYCDDSYAQCIDACPEDCSGTDESCSLCIESCDYALWDCYSHAVWCNVSPSYNPQCTVDFGLHCPLIDGEPDCEHPATHSGYFQTCTRSGQQCVACPDGDVCVGANGEPPCF